MKSLFNIEIGSKPESSHSTHHLSITLHVCEKQLEPLNHKLQNTLKTKRTPLLTIIMPDNKKYMKPPKYFASRFVLGDKGKEHEKHIYHSGDLGEEKTQIMLKKLEKVFHLLTASSQNLIRISGEFYSVEEWVKGEEQQNMKNLLKNAKIDGKLNIDQSTLDTFKKIIGKISPQFLDSPIMAALEIFQLCDLRLQIADFNNYDSKTVESLLGDGRHVIEQDDECLQQMCRADPEQQMKIMIVMEKLFALEIKGSCCLLGCLLSLQPVAKNS